MTQSNNTPTDKELDRVRVRTCNCSKLYLGDGVIRTLLVSHYPRLARINKTPCAHWESANIKFQQEGSHE